MCQTLCPKVIGNVLRKGLEIWRTRQTFAKLTKNILVSKLGLEVLLYNLDNIGLYQCWAAVWFLKTAGALGIWKKYKNERVVGSNYFKDLNNRWISWKNQWPSEWLFNFFKKHWDSWVYIKITYPDLIENQGYEH